MRLWTLHPKYLDPQGLVALWREALLAKAVLRGETRGYRHHPQLERFKACATPRSAINTYLAAVCDEAETRGYAFDRSKVGPARGRIALRATSGQLEYEWDWLSAKLKRRSPARWREVRDTARVEAHPLFKVVAGPVADWEKRS